MNDLDAGAVELRELRESDLKALLAIEREVFRRPWHVSAFRTFLEGGRALSRVAVIDGELAGYALGWCAGGEAELANLAVARAQQRRSVGATLLRWFLAASAACGAREVFLEVRASNESAQRLYRRHGFAEFGRRRNYYGNPREDALLYRALIQPADSGVGERRAAATVGARALGDGRAPGARRLRRD